MFKINTLKSLAGLVVMLNMVSVRLTADPEAFHGMAMFGQEKVYISHLPMLHSPHDYQVLIEVSLGFRTPGAIEYNNNQTGQTDGSKLYSIAPKNNFDLTDLINGGITFFQADLYEGHFEKPGAKLKGNIGIYVKEIIYTKKIELTEPPLARGFLHEYFIFGSKTETYAINLIKQTSYDAILKVSYPTVTSQPICGRGGCTPGPVQVLELPLVLGAFSTNTTEVPESQFGLGNMFSGSSNIESVMLYDKLQTM